MGNFDGRYQLIRRLGAGGMGEVWLAHDEQLHNRPVAIKIMRTDILPQAEDAARFDREMRYAALMQHPSIVTVYTTGSFNAAPYMVMECLEGSDMQRVPPSGPKEAARIGQEVCGALAYAHDRDVIHRDIKPGNLFLCASGQVKVTDFGIAKAISGTTLSSTGVLVGTFAFMAPEQWLGEPAAFSNDVWATGCTLYQFLSGRLPRQFGTVQEYAVAAMRGEPIPDLGDLSSAPRWLTDAVMTMLSQDPAGRPSAAESAQLLAGTPRSAMSPALAATRASRSPAAAQGPGTPYLTPPSAGPPHLTPPPFSTPQPSSTPPPFSTPQPSSTPRPFGVGPAGPGATIPAGPGGPRRPNWRVRVGLAVAGIVVLLIGGLVASQQFKSAGNTGALAPPTPASRTPPATASAAATASADATASATPTAAAGPAMLTLTGVTTQVDSGKAPSFTYTMQDAPAGETAELQRTFGTTFEDVEPLTPGSDASLTPPALPDIGQYSYRIALEQSGAVVSTSPSVNVEAYTNVHLVFFGGQSGSEQVGSHLFNYTDAEGASSYPNYQQNQAGSGTSCRSLTVQFAGDSNAQSDGGTSYLQFTQTATDQIDASVPAGVVKTITVPLDGGPLFINTSSAHDDGIDFNFTGSCYTPSGQPQTSATPSATSS